MLPFNSDSSLSPDLFLAPLTQILSTFLNIHAPLTPKKLLPTTALPCLMLTFYLLCMPADDCKFPNEFLQRHDSLSFNFKFQF